MPMPALLTLDDADRRYARTPTQDAVNRRCLLAQTRHFGSYADQFEPPISVIAASEIDEALEQPRTVGASTVQELDADNITEMLRLPIRSNFRVLARISQLLRDTPDFA